MNVLEIPALRQMRNGLFIRYMKQVVSKCENNNADALLIRPQVNELAGCFPQFNEQFVLERQNALTADLQALDLRRDRAITGIRFHVESLLYHYSEDKVRAAHTLQKTIDKYGKNLARLPYNLETEVIESFVGDCAKNPALAAAVETLGLQEWVKELDSANAAFNQMFLNRSDSNAAQPPSKIPELRVVAMEKYRALANHIFARMVIAPSAAYNTLVDQLNDLTNDYNQLVNNRNANNEDELPDDENDPDAIPPAPDTPLSV
jgi:Family of unknown function (DUF6261)